MDPVTIFVMPRLDSVCVYTTLDLETAASVSRDTGDSPNVGHVTVMEMQTFVMI